MIARRDATGAGRTTPTGDARTTHSSVRLHLRGVAVGRGGRELLRDVTLELGPGEGLQLVGPNGAGKTTLMRAIAGYLSPSGGAISMTGFDQEQSTAAEQMHYVGHKDGLKPALTVIENARFWQRYLGGREDAAARDAALQTFGLAALAEIPAGYLSAGQKRRLGLTRLALAERPLWLLDEPSVSLDRNGQALLADCVNAHLAAGGLVIAATHVPLGMALGWQLDVGVRNGPRPVARALEPAHGEGGRA